MDTKSKKRVALVMSHKEHERAKRAAKQSRCSFCELVRRAVEHYIQHVPVER